MQGRRRGIALLGEMLELGDYTEEAHLSLLRKCQELNLGHVGVVGQRFGKAAETIREKDGMAMYDARGKKDWVSS